MDMPEAHRNQGSGIGEGLRQRFISCSAPSTTIFSGSIGMLHLPLSFKQSYLLANICFPVNKLLTINCAAASLSLLPLLPQLEIVFNEHLCSCDWFFNASVIFHQLQLEIFFGNHLFICKIFLHLLNVAYQLSAVELSRLSNPLKICGEI